MTSIQIRDKRTANRFFVDNTIIRHYGPGLGPYGIAVYCCLCMHADVDDQTCFPSQATIAELIGCSRRKVHDAILLLEELRLIRVERRQKEAGDYDSNIYTLLDPPTLAQDSSAPDAQPSAQDALPNAPRAQGVVHQSNNNNPHIEQSPLNNGSAAGAGAAAPQTPPPKRRRKSKTPPAVGMFRKNAHRYPAKAWYETIHDIVGEEDGSLARWGKVVFHWVGMGWSPVNVKGMLDCYEKGEIPGEDRSSAGLTPAQRAAKLVEEMEAEDGE